MDNRTMQLTLGELISYLEALDPNAEAVGCFGNGNSYRGYYEQLAFEPEAITTAQQMLKEAKATLNKMYYGYKGGEYLMREDTRVNIAEYGCCSSDDSDWITLERLDEMFAALEKAQKQ